MHWTYRFRRSRLSVLPFIVAIYECHSVHEAGFLGRVQPANSGSMMKPLLYIFDPLLLNQRQLFFCVVQGTMLLYHTTRGLSIVYLKYFWIIFSGFLHWIVFLQIDPCCSTTYNSFHARHDFSMQHTSHQTLFVSSSQPKQALRIYADVSWSVAYYHPSVFGSLCLLL